MGLLLLLLLLLPLRRSAVPHHRRVRSRVVHVGRAPGRPSEGSVTRASASVRPSVRQCCSLRARSRDCCVCARVRQWGVNSPGRGRGRSSVRPSIALAPPAMVTRKMSEAGDGGRWKQEPIVRGSRWRWVGDGSEERWAYVDRRTVAGQWWDEVVDVEGGPDSGRKKGGRRVSSCRGLVSN